MGDWREYVRIVFPPERWAQLLALPARRPRDVQVQEFGIVPPEPVEA